MEILQRRGEAKEMITGVGNNQFYMDVWDGGRSSPSLGAIHYPNCAGVARSLGRVLANSGYRALEVDILQRKIAALTS